MNLPAFHNLIMVCGMSDPPGDSIGVDSVSGDRDFDYGPQRAANLGELGLIW